MGYLHVHAFASRNTIFCIFNTFQGKDITLYHFKETSSENNEEYAYQVKLYEVCFLLSFSICFFCSSQTKMFHIRYIIMNLLLLNFLPQLCKTTHGKNISIFVFQHSWIDSNGQDISRDQFIMVLHKVEAILIRASYNTQMLQTTYDL